MASTATPIIGDRSYGIIPLRLTSTARPSTTNTQILLIHQKTIVPSNPYFWTFPKGHAEEGDASLQHTAIREMFEETGSRVGVEDFLVFRNREGEEVEFREVYTNPIRKVGKEVRYWVGVVKGEQELVVQELEVGGAKWVGWDEAERTITFEEGRAILRRVRACLEAGS
ncbi:Bis(5'-nucleosyl)-tetraphosphatase [asymmetrical] [Lachnellula occidentalis]|uniref:Bis(5'-nucleosyl)-tetraphosphatase [asymmetrical] n=1 Tax=Lachnellula occidentalis TaxID=215460 RepID=A0A8H8S8Q7_9HELO|nr:Bis(5'-nucleosyl)-tetraphosphatase [asymmetrical] [Lachnellula occidentalis]